MNKTRLELAFKDELDRKYLIYLDSPREDLDSEEIVSSMEKILAGDVFRNKGVALAKRDSARIVRTEIEEFLI